MPELARTDKSARRAGCAGYAFALASDETGAGTLLPRRIRPRLPNLRMRSALDARLEIWLQKASENRLIVFMAVATMPSEVS